MISDFYKLTFDISYYYIYVAFFLRYAGVFDDTTNAWSYACLIGAVLLSVYLGEKSGNEKLRLLPLILPALAFVWESSLPGRIALLLPWCYFAVVTVRGRYSLYYEQMRGRFKRMLYGFAIIFMAFFYSPEKGIHSVEAAAPYLILFATAGFLLLQSLRYPSESGDKKRFGRYQIYQTLLFFAFCVLISAGKLLQWVSDVIYGRLLKPVGEAISLGVMRLFTWIVETLARIEIGNPRYDDKDLRGFNETKEKLIRNEPNVTPEQLGVEAPVMTEDMRRQLVIFCAVVAIVASIILFAVLIGEKKKRGKTAAIEEEREKMDGIPEKPEKKRRKEKAPEAQVRMQYQQFMQRTNTGRQKLSEADTTAEIREKYMSMAAREAVQKNEESNTALYEQASQELTELYRKSRYAETEITKAEADRAKKLRKKMG